MSLSGWQLKKVAASAMSVVIPSNLAKNLKVHWINSKANRFHSTTFWIFCQSVNGSSDRILMRFLLLLLHLLKCRNENQSSFIFSSKESLFLWCGNFHSALFFCFEKTCKQSITKILMNQNSIVNFKFQIFVVEYMLSFEGGNKIPLGFCI